MGQAHVNEGYELYQIITDFGDPLEIFREGIQNSFDADATNIYIRVFEEAHLSGKKLIKGSLFSYAFILAIDLILSAIKSLIS